MQKDNSRGLKLLVAGVFTVAVGLMGTSVSACRLQYTGEAARMFGSAPRGSFRCFEECDQYRRSSPAFEKVNSRCVNCSSCSAGHSYGGYASSGSFQQQIFMGLMNSFIRGFNQGISRPPSGPSPQERAMLEQQQKQRQEAYRARMREQVKKLEQEYNKITAAEFEKNKHSLISDFKSRYAATIGKKETAKAIRQLNCSAYWGLKAARMLLNGNNERDLEVARLYAEYSTSAEKSDSLSGRCSEVPEIEVQIPPVGAPQPVNFQQDFYKYIVQETEYLKPVIRELRGKKKKAVDIIAVKKKEIEDLKMRSNSPSKEKKEKDVDGLVKEAYKALNEATDQKRKAEEELSETKKKLSALEEMRGFYDMEKTSKEVKK